MNNYEHLMTAAEKLRKDSNEVIQNFTGERFALDVFEQIKYRIKSMIQSMIDDLVNKRVLHRSALELNVIVGIDQNYTNRSISTNVLLEDRNYKIRVLEEYLISDKTDCE
jgi:hypothetical protein